MNVGDDIPQRVMAEIDRASLAIVCLSDQSAAREWITTEVAWLNRALTAGSLKAILPVKVGPLSQSVIPTLLRNISVLTYDPSQLDQAEKMLERLMRAVREHLSAKSPIVTPAALFAMTTAQFEELAPNLAGVKALLCQHLGMQASPESAVGRRTRYGDTVEAFAPFTATKPLVETVYSAVRETK